MSQKTEAFQQSLQFLMIFIIMSGITVSAFYELLVSLSLSFFLTTIYKMIDQINTHKN